jgi:hypothetical protein
VETQLVLEARPSLAGKRGQINPLDDGLQRFQLRATTIM